VARTDTSTDFSASADPGPRGAYGFSLVGVEGVDDLLVTAPDWPPLELVRRIGSSDAQMDSLGDEMARLRLVDGGEMVVEREPARAIYTTPLALSDQELVHPYLAPAAALAARWRGHESLHAGAFVLDGGAWMTMGEKGAGKSFTLASLTQRGVPVVADDVVVVAESRVFAGPRAIDLRAEGARALGMGERMPGTGGRERWRVPLEPTEPEFELRGWILLTWTSGAEAVVKVPPGDRLHVLARSRVVAVETHRPDLLLRLVGLPAFEYRRRAGATSPGDGIERLLEALSS
jgi:hypothetical protein